MGKDARHLNHEEDPLDFIHEDYQREREICASIDNIAEGSLVPSKVVEEMISFLTVQLPMHLMDEEEDLFPLLKRRCLPEDNIAKVIARLHRDHAHAGEDTPGIVALLEALMEGSSAREGAAMRTLAAYASHARRHLILENAIILPFARLRLTDGDLKTLYIRMCQRRGISSLKDARYAQRTA